MTLREELEALVSQLRAEANVVAPKGVLKRAVQTEHHATALDAADDLEEILARHPEPRRVVLAAGTARTEEPCTAEGFGEGDDPDANALFLYRTLMMTPAGRYRLELVGPLPEPPKEAP